MNYVTIKNFLIQFKFLILVNIIFASICSVFFIGTTKPTWKGYAVVKIGQVGSINSHRPYVPELAEDLIQRMHFSNSIDNTLAELKISTNDARKIKDSLRFDNLYDQNSFQVNARAPSTSILNNFFEKFLESLKTNHELKMKPKKDEITHKINDLRNLASKTLKLNTKALSLIESNKNKLNHTLLMLIESQNSLSLNLINHKLKELEDIMSPSQTFSTSTIKLQIEPQPIKPNNKLIFLLFLFLGFVNGLLMSYSVFLFKKNNHQQPL